MKSKIKMPKMDQLLKDKNVLYIVFVVAILNLLGYLITNNLEAVCGHTVQLVLPALSP